MEQTLRAVEASGQLSINSLNSSWMTAPNSFSTRSPITSSIGGDQMSVNKYVLIDENQCLGWEWYQRHRKRDVKWFITEIQFGGIRSRCHDDEHHDVQQNWPVINDCAVHVESSTVCVTMSVAALTKLDKSSRSSMQAVSLWWAFRILLGLGLAKEKTKK